MVWDNICGGRALRIAVGFTVLVLVMAGGAGATKFIRNDATGGDCTSFGTWNNGTKTCTMTADLIETIQIDSNDTTLDGNGYQTAGSGTGYGVNITGRSGVTIKNLNVGQFGNGFYLLNSNNNYLIGNKASSNNYGIVLSGSSSNTLSSNIANSNTYNGIQLDHSSSNALSGNNANSNGYYGIYLSYSDNNTLSGNNANSNNYQEGIYLSNSKINNLTGNNANSNYQNGILLSYSSSNRLGGNNANSNRVNGIYLYPYSNSNRLSGNNANSNNGAGISVSYYSNSNTLSGNNASSNVGNGIYLLNSGDSNMLSGNNALNNNNGGIRLGTNSNTLSGNIVRSNSAYGVYLAGSSNTIYNNFFNNTINLVINTGSNTWNTAKISGTNIIGGPYLGGNFWAQPNGTGFSQTCADGDSDGICDSPNELDSNNIDYLPLTTDLTTDITPPIVTSPSVNQSDIPDDTDNTPLWGETAQLNVTVTDESGISVTINLSEIGGLSAKPMLNIGDNIYSTTTNASAGTPPKLYNLTVNATDIFGNSNTSVVIQLRVMKNGDTTGNGFVNIGDALRLANNVSYPGNPAYALSSIYAADVTGNGVINIGDALRLANNVSYPGNTAYILK
jgi:nitrous oxidase accessory protein